MRFDVSCPTCGKTAKAPEEYIGKKVRCSKCGGKFRVEAPESDEDDDEFDVFQIPFDDDELEDINAEPETPQPKRSANLSDCPDCGGMVSNSAFSCPHCGRPLRGKAVECYLSISREYENGYAARSIGIRLDGQMVGDIENGGLVTLQIDPGQHQLAVGLYGLMGGQFSPSLSESFDVTAGQHLILTFNPCGGFLQQTFIGEWSEKID